MDYLCRCAAPEGCRQADAGQGLRAPGGRVVAASAVCLWGQGSCLLPAWASGTRKRSFKRRGQGDRSVLAGVWARLPLSLHLRDRKSTRLNSSH